MFEVYAFMNVDEVTAVLNGVAALLSAPDFIGLMKVFALLSLLGVVIGIFTGAAKLYGLPVYLISMVVIIVVFTYPRTVTVIDSANNGHVTVVDNVPMGMAVMISSVSHIGLYLTKATETVFSLPDDLKFQKNGMMFGSRMVSSSKLVAVNDQNLRTDFILYVRNCVNPDLMDGYKDANLLRYATDIWAVMGDTNPARWMSVHDSTGTAMIPLNCPSAYVQISQRWGVEITRNWNRLGKSINYKETDVSVSNNLLQSQLADGYATMLGIGSTAPQIIQQNMLMNLYEDAEMEIAAQVGNTARLQQAMAKAQAQVAMAAQYATTAKLAEELLPKVRNVAELIIYALFPVMLLMMLITGLGAYALLKQYLFALFWIQLWAPLYAVLNFVMTTSTSKQMKATLDTASPGLSLLNVDAIQAVAIEQHHIAGMMSMAIPVLAWAIAKSGEMGGAAMLGGVFSTAQKSGDMAASSASSGNVSAGNVSMNNGSWNNNNANSNATSVKLDTGGFSLKDGFGGTVSASRNGTTTYQAPSNDPGALSLQTLASQSDVMSTAASNQIKAAEGQVASAQQQQVAAIANLAATSNSKVDTQQFSKGTSAEEGASFARNHAKTQSMIDSVAKNADVSKSIAANAVLGVGMNFGLNANLSSQLGSASSEKLMAAAKQAVGEERSSVEGYVSQLKSNESFAASVASSQSQSQGLSASLTNSQSKLQSAQASLEKAQTLQSSAEAAKGIVSSMGANALKSPYASMALKAAVEAIDADGKATGGQNFGKILSDLKTNIGGESQAQGWRSTMDMNSSPKLQSGANGGSVPSESSMAANHSLAASGVAAKANIDPQSTFDQGKPNVSGANNKVTASPKLQGAQGKIAAQEKNMTGVSDAGKRELNTHISKPLPNFKPNDEPHTPAM